MSAGPLWIGRPIETPGSRPVTFDSTENIGLHLTSWPVAHVIKCLVFYHPDDPEDLRLEQERQCTILFDACRRTGHELLLEVIPSKSAAPVGPDTLARAMTRFYALGIHPDWWKLPQPGSEAAWEAIAGTIAAHDPHCRGVLLLGLDAPEAELEAAFALAARQPVCKGFAVGRTIFGKPAEAWFKGEIDDRQAVASMAAGYRRLIEAWERACAAPR